MSDREELGRPCETDDLIRDYVGDGREYRGHNGTCGNCGKEYSESADEDLSDVHWLHTIESNRAHWEATTPEDVKGLALAMDPDDPKLTNRAPYRATGFAENLLASDWLAKHDADLLAPLGAIDDSQLRNLGHVMEVAQSHERFRGSGKDPRNVAAQAAIDWLICLLASTDPTRFRFEPPPYRAVIDAPAQAEDDD